MLTDNVQVTGLQKSVMVIRWYVLKLIFPNDFLVSENTGHFQFHTILFPNTATFYFLNVIFLNNNHRINSQI